MPKFNLKKAAMDSAGLIAGGVAAGYVSKVVPIENEKIKAAAPIIAGVLLMQQKGILGQVGAGMVAGGGAKLAESFGIGAMPDMDDEIEGIFDEDEIEGLEDEIEGYDDEIEGMDDIISDEIISDDFEE